MTSPALFYAMFFHVCWAALLYTLLTIFRAPSIWGIDTKSGGIRKLACLEPRVSANLSNQFEWPLFFHSACLLTMLIGSPSDGLQAAFAWLFVGGRVIHSYVQILTTNIRLRGAVFTINFLAVFFMWVNLAVKMAS